MMNIVCGKAFYKHAKGAAIIMPLITNNQPNTATSNYQEILNAILSLDMTYKKNMSGQLPAALESTFVRYAFKPASYSPDKLMDLNPSHYSIYYIAYPTAIRHSSTTFLAMFPCIVHNKFISKLSSAKVMDLLKNYVIIKSPVPSFIDLDREIHYNIPAYYRSSRHTRASYLRIWFKITKSTVTDQMVIPTNELKQLLLEPSAKSEIIALENQLPTTYLLQNMLDLNILNQIKELLPFLYHKVLTTFADNTPESDLLSYFEQMIGIGILAATPYGSLFKKPNKDSSHAH